MDIETAANPAGVEDTRPVDTGASVEAAQGATAPAGGDTDTNANAAPAVEDDLLADFAPEPDEVDVEYEGSKYKVPPALKDALMRDADYRHKTMALADQRREAEARIQQAEQLRTMTAAEVQTVTRLEALKGELAQYQNVQWHTLDPTDPEVQQAKWRYDQLVQEAQGLNGQLAEHFRLKGERAQQESAKQREATDREMAKVIQDWSPAKRQELESFAAEQGVSPEDFAHASAAELKSTSRASAPSSSPGRKPLAPLNSHRPQGPRTRSAERLRPASTPTRRAWTITSPEPVRRDASNNPVSAP
jgi:hypothetical protein